MIAFKNYFIIVYHAENFSTLRSSKLLLENKKKRRKPQKIAKFTPFLQVNLGLTFQIENASVHNFSNYDCYLHFLFIKLKSACFKTNVCFENDKITIYILHRKRNGDILMTFILPQWHFI